MAEYTMEVSLPSKGIPYPDNPELAGKIVLRSMTADDEKVVFGSQGDKMTTNLLKRCIKSPEIDPDDLILADRQFLFLQLRIFTYGDKYHVPIECGSCDFKGEKEISLTDDLVVHEAPDWLEPIMTIELPRSKHKVDVKLLTVKEIDKIAKRAKNFAKKTGQKMRDVEYMYRKQAQLVTVDGKELGEVEKGDFFKDLPALDSAAIEAKIGAGLKIGYDYIVNTTCPECSEEIETVFTPTTEFFRPRFD